MVRKERLELSHHKIPEPKSGASTNSATFADKLTSIIWRNKDFITVLPPKVRAPASRRSKYGVDDGTRTHDNKNHNLALYQLSYAHQCLARPAGLEPATLGLEGRCSIRMSYGRFGVPFLVISLRDHLVRSRNAAGYISVYIAETRSDHPSGRTAIPAVIPTRKGTRCCQRLEGIPNPFTGSILPYPGSKFRTPDRIWSGWRDSNSRPTAPKAVALPGCATPRFRPAARAAHYPTRRGIIRPSP